ncbi:hypothetical protein ZIOFF_071896 [Zingiber officinale]|uniref:Uncharacterized protein n=1 Tax=Zingiber officinale TaxID=94328 RepID=A0A8J5BEU2_ZINOF|nr:hypothetical protein ZIOFF_071896 [Zingiber officinale]
MVVVAFLLVAVLAASSAPAAQATFCFPQCYNRCANGKVGNVACSTMCAQACIVPRTGANAAGHFDFKASISGGGNA